MVAVGQSHCGVDTGDSGTVKVESGASLAAVGARDGIDGSVSGGGTVFLYRRAGRGFRPGGRRDRLAGQQARPDKCDETTLYTDEGRHGAVEPGQTSNLLTLNGAVLGGGYGSGLFLPAGENETPSWGKNSMECGITLAEGKQNSLTLSGSGSLKLIKMTPESTHVKPLIGTDGVRIAAPEPGWYATAVAGRSHRVWWQGHPRQRVPGGKPEDITPPKQ